MKLPDKEALQFTLRHLPYFVIVVALLLNYGWFHAFVIIPAVHEEINVPDWFNTGHKLLACIVLLNVVSNLMLCSLMDSSIKAINLASFDQDGWAYCQICKCNQPPRAWHCNECHRCILKRDHHCYLLGNCIGFYNYKYFFNTIFVSVICMGICLLYCIWLLSLKLSWDGGSVILKFLLPLLSLAVDFNEQSILISIFLVDIIVFFIFFYVLVYHVLNIIQGTTSPERKKNYKDKHNYGLESNIIEALGRKWYISWALPFMCSSLPGDGFTWNAKKQL